MVKPPNVPIESASKSSRISAQRAWRRRAKRYLYVLLPVIGLAVLLAQPRWLFTVLSRVMPGATYALTLPKSPDPIKVVALTIDDGPSTATGDILAVLHQYNVKATFFNISGHVVSESAAVIEQMVRDGHELGNHLTADEPSIRMTPDEFEADLLAAEQTFLPYLQGDLDELNSPQAERPGQLRWLRPGMGWYNTEMVNIAHRHGYRLVLGSVFPYDTHVPFSWFATAFILHTVRSGDVIVLHDGDSVNGQKGRGQRTVATLKVVIPRLKAQGYTITSLSEMLEMAEMTE
ncbi:MAG: polysaccharide deacetylase family protein [Phormidesmis sp. RL_2_1]|nr:polysaccharide deacetylase family protein [Phormidesmis sp. RL_2_1]